MSIRVVLADDHPIVLHSLEQLFARQADIQVVATCPDATGALDVIRTEAPDVLVLDLKMTDVSGMEVLRALSRERQPTRTVLLTASIGDDDALEAAALGAAIVMKDSSADDLLDVVRRVARGDVPPVGIRAADPVPAATARPRAVDALTPREREIVRMVARGMRNRTIADRLSISEGTVKVHLHNIYEKLGVDGRLELVLAAQQRGLV